MPASTVAASAPRLWDHGRLQKDVKEHAKDRRQDDHLAIKLLAGCLHVSREMQ